MVISQLLSGLGNQLFQYAIGRRIAFEHKVPLKLDLTWFENHKLPEYNLHRFNIIENIATPAEISYVKNQFYLKEKSFVYNPHFLMVPPDVYVDGYWQNEQYFKDIEGIIRKEFNIKIGPSVKNIAIAMKINSCESVSLHIRRGDYLSSPVHHICTLDYYHSAVRFITAKVHEPHFFIFSDDWQWAQENLKIDYPMTFIRHNDEKHCYEDIRLISLCRHHIIANSTFSWWGAWLSNSPKKIVCAPQKWFNEGFHSNHNIIPNSWHQITS